jgi:hypothetical protein
MTLYEKICQIYDTLTINDFTTDGTILLALDEDGNEIIQSWNHPDLAKPTAEQLSSM